MTSDTLAAYADLSVYSAMALFTVAMIGYAVYLAGLVPNREADDAEAQVDARELVGAGASGATSVESPQDGSDGSTSPDERTPLRARKAAGIAGSLAWLGTGLLVLACLLRGLSAGRPPLGNMFEFAVVGSTLVMVLYCGWSLRRDLRWLGLFAVGPTLLTLGLAVTTWYTESSQLLPSLQSYWLVIHVSVAILSVAFCTIGVSLAILYLVQRKVEAEGRASFMNRLPGSRELEKLTYSVHIIAFPLWTFTLIAGGIWAHEAWGSYWNWDPKEVWTFVIWVVYAAYLHARATSGWSREKATYIAVAGFACILVNYTIVNVFFVGQHSYSGL